MENEVAEKKNTSTIEFEVSGEKIKLSPEIVRAYLTDNPKVTSQEIMFFMSLARAQKLNPWTKDIYLVKYGTSPAQIITSKEAFMKRAESHPAYAGFEAGIVVEREGQLHELKGAIKLSSDKLVGGWARVYRKDRDIPSEVFISLDEFGKSQSTWKSMPNNMIRKTAIVNALRESFPENLNGMYTEEDGGKVFEQKQPREVNGVHEPTEEEMQSFDKEKYLEQKKAEMAAKEIEKDAQNETQEVLEGEVIDKEVTAEDF